MKPRHLKSINTINAEPTVMSSKTQNILLLDIAGATGMEIARIVGLSEPRVSIIRNSPMFKQQRELRWTELKNKVIEKHSNTITNEALKEEARTHALDILKGFVNIAKDTDSGNVFARIAAGKEVFKRGGFDDDKRRGVTIEVSEQWAERWDRLLSRDERSKPERKYKIRVTETLPS